jgi:hypothetical protein
MSDTPKFEVIDRRRMKAEEEKEQTTTTTASAPEPVAEAAPSAGPRLVVPEQKPEAAEPEAGGAEDLLAGMPPAPTMEESHQQKSAYESAAQRLEDLVRAQNPGAGAQPPVGFEHLVQQLYLSAMIQMGAGAPEGQRPRVDILGAKQTIDMMGVLSEKTKGNLNETEDRMLQTVLFEARMAFLELTSMITLQGVPTPPPPGVK